MNEHGSWAMIFVPFASALLFDRYFNSNLLLFLVCILFFFFSYRPWEMYFKASSLKKPRVQIEYPLTWFLIYLGAGLFFGGITLLQFNDFRLIGYGFVALLFFTLGQIAINRFKNDFIRDVMSICGITIISAATDFLVYTTMRYEQLVLWGLNAAFFLSSAFYVHMKMLSVHRSSKTEKQSLFRYKRTLNVVFHLVLLVSLLYLFSTGMLSSFAALSPLPIILHALAGSFIFPDKTNFKRIGIIFSFYSLLFCFLLSF